MGDLRNLRNDDFRRLLATPSSSGTSRSRGGDAKETPHGFTHKQWAASGAKKPHHKHPHKPSKEQEEDDIFDESQSRLNEIMRNYRDRASERRKGAVPEDDALLRAKMTAAYRAVPGTFAAAASQADRRRAEIQESKFLGGDIEHTHLVKGLDYSLLNKVRRELEDGEERDELERVYEEEQELAKPVAQAPVPSSNKMVRNLSRLLTTKQQQPQGNEMPTRNEMFARGRMAYIVELGEEVEGADDVPATLMRSVHDCPDPMADAVNADAVLISVSHHDSPLAVYCGSGCISGAVQKLTQVLGYLRSDPKRRKHPDEGRAHTSTASLTSSLKSGISLAKGPPPTTAGSGVKIFDDVDSEYAPSSRISKSSRKESTKRQEEGSGQSESRRSYFDDYRRTGERRGERERDERRRERSQERNSRTETSDSRSDRKRATESREHASLTSAEVKVGGIEAVPVEEDSKLAAKKRRLEEEEDAYAELYPMGAGMVFAGGDSDDEGEDFSKMDMGNKKGPVKRWDFESQGEFEKYQGAREAVPKAAFQYGMKTNEGRKTRKNAAAEKAAEERKLDREMDRINKVWDERKKSAPESAGRNHSRY